MQSDKVDVFIEERGKYFLGEDITLIRGKLAAMDDADFSRASLTELKSPDKYFFISLFLGLLGVDRFMLGNMGMGVFKLILCGMLLFILAKIGVTPTSPLSQDIAKIADIGAMDAFLLLLIAIVDTYDFCTIRERTKKANRETLLSL